MLLSPRLRTYRSAILRLPSGRGWNRNDLLVPELLVSRDGELAEYYAPHNEYAANSSARVAIVGLTPGWSQMKLALEAARRGLEAEESDEDVCRMAKEAAGLAGGLRRDLLRMLDALGLQRELGIASCERLFDERRELLHTTALLRYPVFLSGANYNGSRPPLLGTPSLREAALRYAREELPLWKPALVIPLGRTVEGTLRLLVRDGGLKESQCLWGFPHPSGANGHRHRQFAERREEMERRMADYFRSRAEDNPV